MAVSSLSGAILRGSRCQHQQITSGSSQPARSRARRGRLDVRDGSEADIVLNSRRVVDASYCFLPAERNAMFDRMPSHLGMLTQTGRCRWSNIKSAMTTGPDTKGTWEDGAGSRERCFSIGLRHARACDGSISVAATVPSRSCSSSDARRLKFRELIRPRRNSPSRAPGPRRVAQRFTRATPWRFHFPRTGSIPLSWRW